MILLNFNIINPEILERNKNLVSKDELLKMVSEGTQKILIILEKYLIQSTFFIEISLVEDNAELIKLIVKKGHEIGILNKNSNENEIKLAKDFIEEITQKTVRGIRQFPENRVSSEILKNLGFIYRSPMNFSKNFLFRNPLKNKTAYEENELMVIPESISPYSRIPYNDFSFQFIPMKYYQSMVSETLQNNEYVMIYLNSWQFLELNDSKFGLKFYRKYNLGKDMEKKLDIFLKYTEDNEVAITRVKDFFF